MFEEVKELQEKELYLLKELKKICDRNEITYFLAYGSLLGAVRHQGFIPWDDDIDVCMNYSDYLKFEKVCEKELGSDFFLQTRDTEPDAGLSYNKLRLNNTTLIIDYMADRDINHGINIDIYPIYNVADNSLMRSIQFAFAVLYMLLEAQQVPQNHGKIIQIVSKGILLMVKGNFGKWLKKKCYKYMGKYENRKTKYKAMLFGNLNVCRHLYPSEIFGDTVQMKFEDEMFSVPVGYKKCLMIDYGDYMQMPPVEEQGVKLEHIVKVDTNNSYTQYKGTLYCVK